MDLNSISKRPSFLFTVFIIFLIVFSRKAECQWNQFATVSTLNPSHGPRFSDFEIFQGELYVLGNFDMVDGVGANKIAKYDGTTWTGLPINLEYGIELKAYQNHLYIIGYTGNLGFGALDNEYITRWDGSNWKVLKDTAFSPVNQADIPDPRSMAVYNGLLFIGGDNIITSAAPSESTLAIWDGTSFLFHDYQIYGTIFDLESNGSTLGIAGQIVTVPQGPGHFGLLDTTGITQYFPNTASLLAQAIIHNNHFTYLTVGNENLFINGSWSFKSLKGVWDDHLYYKNTLVYGSQGNINQIDIQLNNQSNLVGDSLFLNGSVLEVFNDKLIAGSSEFTTLGTTYLYSLDTNQVLGTESKYRGGLISLFPNPSSDFLNLNIESSIFKQGSCMLEIIDLNGSEVLSQNLNSATSRIPISNLVSGVYIARIRANGRETFRKIIKD